LLREVVLALGQEHAEANELIAAAGVEPPAALNEAIQQNPDKADGYRDRGNWYGERRQWKAACADFAKACQLEPDTYPGMLLGIILVHAGEIHHYREHCRAMLDRWAATDKNAAADQALKTLMLLPLDRSGRDADAKQLARLAEVAVAGDDKQDWFEWFLFAKGLHDYRIGKDADALTACRESRRRTLGGRGNAPALATMNLAIEAMALHRSGDQAGAKRALTGAKSNLDGIVLGLETEWWHDALAAHLFFREAKSSIEGKTN